MADNQQQGLEQVGEVVVNLIGEAAFKIRSDGPFNPSDFEESDVFGVIESVRQQWADAAALATSEFSLKFYTDVTGKSEDEAFEVLGIDKEAYEAAQSKRRKPEPDPFAGLEGLAGLAAALGIDIFVPEDDSNEDWGDDDGE